MSRKLLTDRFGRTITYVRLSVTDRCDFRCVYCMAEDMTFLPRAQILTLEEIARVARTFMGLGVHKIRLTGGSRWYAGAFLNWSGKSAATGCGTLP